MFAAAHHGRYPLRMIGPSNWPLRSFRRAASPIRIGLSSASRSRLCSPMVEARVGACVRVCRAPTVPLPEIVVHDAPEIGAPYGAACMLHQRVVSLENDLLVEDSAKACASQSNVLWDDGHSEEEGENE